MCGCSVFLCLVFVVVFVTEHSSRFSLSFLYFLSFLQYTCPRLATPLFSAELLQESLRTPTVQQLHNRPYRRTKKSLFFSCVAPLTSVQPVRVFLLQSALRAGHHRSQMLEEQHALAGAQVASLLQVLLD